MKYVETNLNPTGKKVGDCVVRAIMRATGQTWTTVYHALCYLGEQLHRMPNDKKVYETYLESLGWKKQRMPKDTHGFRYPVHKLADEKPNATLVISVANHLTVVENNTLIDTWDCARKCVGNYWVK